MSIAKYSYPQNMPKKSFHQRNDSDSDSDNELDVFEASRYFSGCSNESIQHCSTYYQQNNNNKGTTREDIQQAWKGRRVSLDMPMIKNGTCHDKQIINKDKIKYKQPSSPGAKLASFLNALFNQANSKKKKSIKAMKKVEDHDIQNGVNRRKRRNSISGVITTANDSIKPCLSTTSSGFRTMPPYVKNTPTQTIKDLRSYSDHKQAVSNTGKLINKPCTDVSGHLKKLGSEKLDGKYRIWDDDGAESDSSSDLFELQNYDLGGNLPVYETTNMESFKRGAPICNATL